MDEIRSIGEFEGWITVAEARDILKISRPGVHYHIRMGHLRAKRAGSVFLIEKTSVERLHHERQQKQTNSGHTR